MPFNLPPALLAALRVRQAMLKYHPDEQVQRLGEGFLLDPGMGPEIFLLADGRVILDERAFFGTEVREASPDEGVAGILVGAEKTGIVELLGLLPPPPADAVICGRCTGSRWWTIGRGQNGADVTMVCVDCHGRGWMARAAP